MEIEKLRIQIANAYSKDAWAFLNDLSDLKNEFGIGSRPNKPKKPTLNSNHTSATAKMYAEELAEYEKQEVEYKNDISLWGGNTRIFDEQIKRFICNNVGIENVPEQYREKLIQKAWDDAHSNGWYEFKNELESLIDIF